MGRAKDETLVELEAVRNRLYRQLMEIGDLRPGSVYQTYRSCGKKGCACARKGHPGHILYLRTTATRSKNRTQVLHLGPELDKALRESANYRRFVSICRQVVETNERICDLRPLMRIQPEELELLKRRLQTRLNRLFGIKTRAPAGKRPRKDGVNGAQQEFST